ncbi:MAG: hypothetical protein DRJ66_06575 [Thermoprotei archaeon]|nr:MAG: hypothetical protein DRJ66_06575 [Thermoprotei archaeon]RLF20667.1 MAG: hypothetical protein DRZ82_01440 [Thermoprotei archaeon]
MIKRRILRGIRNAIISLMEFLIIILSYTIVSSFLRGLPLNIVTIVPFITIAVILGFLQGFAEGTPYTLIIVLLTFIYELLILGYFAKVLVGQTTINGYSVKYDFSSITVPLLVAICLSGISRILDELMRITP